MPLLALAPLAVSAVKGIASIFSNKAKRDKEKRDKAQAEAANSAYETAVQGWQKGLTGTGEGSLSSLIASNPSLFGPQTTTSTSTTNQNQYERPEFADAASAGMADMLIGKYKNRVDNPYKLGADYMNQQIRNIQASGEKARTAMRNVAARHGLSKDVLAVGDPNQRNINQQINQLRANMPLQNRQLESEDLANLGDVLTKYKLGRRSSGTSTTQGSQTGPGNVAAALQAYQYLAPKAPTVIT